MNFHPAVHSQPLFHEVFSKIEKEAETVLSLPGREKASQLADRFFTYLQDNLELFNGADPKLNALIDRLKPYKPDQLGIEPLLQKIITDGSDKKVVPFPSKELEELTTQFLQKQKGNFSVSETLGMCCLLAAKGMQHQATLLFNFHTLKHFIKDPQEFTKQLLNYEKEAQSALDSSGVKMNTSVLRNLFKASIIQGVPQDIRYKIPRDLFDWIQNGERGEKELFQGYEQLVLENYERAFGFFEEAAKCGNSQAFVEIGNCYWSGKGVAARDYNKAFDWFNRGAYLGNSEACLAIGNCYWTGSGVPAKDFVEVFKWFEKAADLGNSLGFLGMGHRYWSGKGVPAIDHARAFECFEKAVNLGNSMALVSLGLCYWSGDGAPIQDYVKAFECYNQAFELGNHSVALFPMANCYWSGKGVPAIDYVKAFEYYKQSVDLGISHALSALGNCYLTGRGVPQDYSKAFECFEKAAHFGYSEGFLGMATCYSNGNGVPQDDKKSFECWLKSKELKNDFGALQVAKCLTLGLGTQENREEARAILVDLISRNGDGAQKFYDENFSDSERGQAGTCSVKAL